MMTDPQVSFVALGAAAVSLVGAAGVAVPIGDPIDLLGLGSGVAPTSVIGNPLNGFYGVDPGIGRMKPEIQVNIGTALATGTAATAEFVIQYAPDTGLVGGYLPGTWEDASTTGVHAVAEYAALAVVRMDVPPAPINTPTPRFVRMILRVPAATNMTAGTVTFAGLIMARDDLVNRNAPNNYSVL